MEITIYTDGACSGNPGEGGYCAIVKMLDDEFGDVENVISGYEAQTTNNRMELTAVVKGLESLEFDNCDITVVSDSKYVCDAINKGWLIRWKNNGWRKADKKAVSNKDLWEQIDKQISKNNISFRWIKGHNGYPENERCDKIAVSMYNSDTNKMADTLLENRAVNPAEEIYPLTIISDRYNGVYSGGKFIAWYCYPEEIPCGIFEDDVSCDAVWTEICNDECGRRFPKYGVGDTIKDAINNLYIKLSPFDTL